MLRLIGLSVLVSLVLVACGSNKPDSGMLIERPTEIVGVPVLSDGQEIYNKYCAHCHGFFGEGQIQVTIEQTESMGYHTVPPHNADGHTWKHPDALLIQTIKQGINNPLDLYLMAPYEDVLSDEDIIKVLSYIKLWWTDEQRLYQREQTDAWNKREAEANAAGD